MNFSELIEIIGDDYMTEHVINSGSMMVSDLLNDKSLGDLTWDAIVSQQPEISSFSSDATMKAIMEYCNKEYEETGGIFHVVYHSAKNGTPAKLACLVKNKDFFRK